jgi:molybdopterin-biosynthesis enzyme MoeA-like protein
MAGEELTFPAVAAGNIYVLPGVPEIFRQKFQALRERFRESPYHLRSVFVSIPESTLADHLNALLRQHPDLMLGSYPEFFNPEYKVKVTLESKDQRYVERALEDLLAGLPASVVVRVER